MERAPETCILCRMPARDLLIEKDGWKVHRCPACGLGFLDPRPSEGEIERLYQSEYFSDQYDEGLDPASSAYRKRLSGEQHRVKFVKSIKRSGTLLDIGCGYGYFLDACRRAGYQVHGLDVSDWAVRYAVETLGLAITTGKIGDIIFPPQSYDIITMWHSLEHTPDPQMVLQKAKSWLKPQGILVIDVPNYEGTDAQKLWQQWNGWQLPYHFWHFTLKSLGLLLKQYGFKIVKYKDYHSDVVKAKYKPIPIVGLFARMIAKMYSGTSVAVVAKLE